jgi:hypothetical protein
MDTARDCRFTVNRPWRSEKFEHGKVMKALKRAFAVILTGYQIYHNCARPIEGLEGMTPEEE